MDPKYAGCVDRQKLTLGHGFKLVGGWWGGR